MTETALTDALAALGIAPDGTQTPAPLADLDLQTRLDHAAAEAKALGLSYRREDLLDVAEGRKPWVDRTKLGAGRNPRFRAAPTPDYRLSAPEFAADLPDPDRPRIGPVTLEEFLRRSRIPPKFRRETFGTWATAPTAEPRDELRRWQASWPPKQPFALLQGPPGLGKTHLVCALLREHWEQRRPLGAFWSVPDLLDRYRATQRDTAPESLAEVDRELENCPLLVLDDFGKQRSTEFADERFYGLVDARYTQERPTVFTTNVSLGGDATADRVSGRRDTLVIEMTGQSWRSGGAR